MIPIEILCRRL